MSLPPGWTETTIGEVAETKLGKMLSAKSKVGTNPRPYLRNKNVQWGRIDVDDLLGMDFSDEEFELFRLRPDDLLVCEGGEVGRAAIWRDPAREIAFQKALHRIRPRAEVKPEFLLYLLMWFSESNAFERFVTGSTIKHLPQEDLRRLPLPLPPLAEQRRIVAAIEEQFSRLDSTDPTLKASAQRLIGLRGLLMRNAFAGLPQRQLGAFATVAGGHTPRGLASTPGGTIPFYKVGDMNAAGPRGRMESARTYLSPEAADSYRVRLWPPGTVIFPKQGGAIATNKKRVLTTDAACDLNTMGVVPGEALDPDYLYRWIDTLELGSLSDGSVVPQIKPSRVAELQIPLPSLDEQRSIVAEIERQLSLIDALRAAVESAQKRSAGLRRAILERAFRGELVPQDPDDEPATALLERIRAERAAAPPARRARTVRAGP